MTPFRLAAVGLLCCASATFAQLRSSAIPKNEQVQLAVREFCRQDFAGARLTADDGVTSSRSRPGRTIKTFHIVSRYEQASVTTGYRSGHVGVKYMVIGRFELGAGYAPLSESEDVDFKLKEIDGTWRIDETDPDLLEPHLSKQAALQWLQQKQKTVTDPGDKVSIETALKALAPTQK